MASNGAESPEKPSAAGAPSRAPPAGPPPPPPPGIAVAGGADVDLHQDIARSIGHQVEVMILDAKHNSETKVGKEIQKIKQKMEAMAEKIKKTTERVAAIEPGRNGLLKSDLQTSITKLEEVWEGEVGTLKHELWQTIQAHNHNADLLKHHKDAIDQVQLRMIDLGPDPELEQVHAQLMAVDKVMQKELQKEQQMDQLMSRLTLVQQQLMGAWGGGSQALFAAQAAAAGGAALNPALASQACAAVAAGKKQQRKAPKAAKGAKAASAASMASMANAASLRAEAPEFVPTWGGSDS